MIDTKRPPRLLRRTLAIAVPLGLAACSLQPRYERPAQPVPNQYPGGPAYRGAPRASTPAGVTAADLGWQDFFKDPKLRRLIEIALKNNRDLRVATFSIEEARAQYAIQRAAQFPSLSANAGAASSRLPSTLRGGLPSHLDTFTAGVGLNPFEIDLFGRVRSLKDAALEQYLALTAVRRAVQISLVSEVASAYLTLQADQALLKLSQDTLEVQQQTVEMVKRGKSVGGMAELDVHRAQTQLEAVRVGVEQYTRQVAQDRNALSMLIGAPVPANLLPPQAFGDATPVAELPAGLPSALLEQRPDIIAAEHRLKAANANIGAARAAFFPSISLTGSVGVASAALAGLFSSGLAWGVGAALSMPIFDGGANQGNLDAAKARKNIDIALYERTVQQAFREVSDDLAARGTYDREAAAAQAQRQEIEDTRRLSEVRFRNGVDDYFPVFDAERQLYTVQQSLVTIRLARLTSRVALYKALGGGWSRTTGAKDTVAQADPDPVRTSSAPLARPVSH
ncbi:MAG TPA: efflux transporter outer membrane subunit [Bordetella sp.]|uniref:efflux transporter outer membrane subunit n=1 Tax=Bordetella sp. TaxID=28081 RepID=UPI002ED4AD6A